MNAGLGALCNFPCNCSALQFASANLAAPLGVPDLWAYDGLQDQISAGGGQMVTCRDMLRLGQYCVVV